MNGSGKTAKKKWLNVLEFQPVGLNRPQQWFGDGSLILDDSTI